MKPVAMMKTFVLPAILFLFVNTIEAQIKIHLKSDSLNVKQASKTRVSIDTGKKPIALQTEEFNKIDSADINLKNSAPISRFGKVDIADLKLKTCDFEKDANAMVLFDRAEMYCGEQGIIMIRQKRIKIFNENGKAEANIRIEFNNKFGAEHILAVEAETINLDSGTIKYTKVDPKLMYGEHTDQEKDAIVFTMPNIKAGSIIEYRYSWQRNFSRNFPEWDFQSSLQVRYSQINVLISPHLTFSALYRNDQPFIRDTVSVEGYGHVWALANIPSSKDEPYMRSAIDALQSITLMLNAVNVYGKITSLSESWQSIGKQIAGDKLFSKPYDQNLNDDEGHRSLTDQRVFRYKDCICLWHLIYNTCCYPPGYKLPICLPGKC